MKASIQKVILIPICSIYRDGQLVSEQRMKPQIIYIGNEFDLKKFVSNLEEKVDEQFISKFTEANGQ